MLELTFLGSGNAFSQSDRYWSSFLAEKRCLFDEPTTVLPHMKRLKLPLAGLEVIFISHFHGDHFMGLPFLFLEYAYLTERRDDLFIVGPPGVGEAMEEFAERCFGGITREVGYRRRYVDARPGREQKAGTVTFQAVPMNHVRDRLECFGYRVDIGGRRVAYTGDTMICDEIYELAAGADVLVLDCTYSQGSGPEHLGADEIKTIRERVPPETAMILTHLDGEPDTGGLANVIVARDLATYCFA
ncbi:MAG: ribonuclease Z [Dehalococcoidia bacterium]